ncbi:NAD 5'-nucleotidase [Vibrio hippocampi]|uniref:NAD 5'-nucleotidase n=2 Tax=Vibrio hippocampi TaxID=654686 RepID=A0ABN8DNP8_9VIBR|nr:NAD 5'-nucleotidase [Vibrio hippocampi]
MKKQQKPLTVSIAHINDTHSYFEPTPLQLTVNHLGQDYHPFVSAGGFARIATRVKALKQQADTDGFLFLHAGDCFQGTLYFSLFKGEANADLLNQLDLDAMALGNHELDLGNEPVGQFVRRINFPLLAGNWNLSQEGKKQYPLANQSNLYHYDPEQQVAQWIEKRINGDSVAIFGLSLDKMADIANPDSDTWFESAQQTAENTLRQIRQAGINKIILLSHLGYDADLELAKAVSGISLIIGGHSHVLQGNFSELGIASQDQYGEKVADTYVVQAGYHALTLGHCEVTFDSEGVISQFAGNNELLVGRRLFVNTEGFEADNDYDAIKQRVQQHPNVVVCRKDPQIKRLLIEKYQTKVRALQQEKLISLPKDLRHIRIPDAQGGSEVAPLVARSFYYAMRQLGYQVDFAMHNAGGVRTSLNQGPLSVADVAGRLLPFVVPIGVYEIQGEHIAAVIEGAINNALGNGVNGTGSGSYPYTYLLTFQYDADAPQGKRVTDIMIAGEPLDLERRYMATSSAYTMKGKEGYDAILQMNGEGIVTEWSMSDCFVKLLSEQPEVATVCLPQSKAQQMR